ncbi:MAG: HAD-IC family P-type ATPase [Chloroflexi bacterium]|nr:HAD-IC family P-type ATPase [Chloroflexota bacterium]
MSDKPIRERWYDIPAAEVMHALATDERGLTSGEASARLTKYGPNELRFRKRGALARFALQFKNALIYVLLAAALVTAILDMWVDTTVILLVVFANAIIGFIQEGKAEAAMEALTKMIVPECMVIRDGEQRQIPARELVPGDIAILNEGDRIPADLRLFHARNLSAEESALTGESVPVDKETGPIPGPDLTPADQRCMAFSGTFVTRGTARGVVVTTGEHTEIGKIAKLMKETSGISGAPLLRKMAEFTKALLVVVLILAAINLILGATIGGYGFVYSFLASVSLAVAAVPEGLPAILTIALAFGARAMFRRHALIRKLPAVETLGSATVICSDKTGTLTRGEMTVVHVYSGRKDYRITGAGYEPAGQFSRDGAVVDPSQEYDLFETLKAGMWCNGAHLVSTDGRYKILGDPTEGALVVAAQKAGIGEDSAKLDEIPFDSTLRYMATLHSDGDSHVIYVKGSPEKIVKMCNTQLVNGAPEPIDPAAVTDKVNEMAEGALRVLGMAYKRVESTKTSLAADDLDGMIFLGLQGMIDPPREEAIEAVVKCKRAGIRVVMITGDHATTALAIARQLGIADENSDVLTGEQMAEMSDEDLYDLVDWVPVYARVAPVHKYRVTTELQRRGHIVAMTGDGVNDAPALKAANIGIAMGIKGTDVTKEAADMVLLDDNFASIVAAVEEGRHVFENIRKVILYTLPTNGGQALLIIGAIALVPFSDLFAERLPLEPVQILWINLYDAVVLALPLLWEPREAGLLDRPPRSPKQRIADTLFVRKVGIVSVVMAGAAFFVYHHYGSPAVSGGVVDEHRLAQAQTAAFMTVMMVHIFYLLTARSLTRSAFAMNPFSNKWIVGGIAITIVLQIIIVYPLSSIGFSPLRTEPFPAEWWIIIVLLGLPGLLLVELEETLAEKWKRRKAPMEAVSHVNAQS